MSMYTVYYTVNNLLFIDVIWIGNLSSGLLGMEMVAGVADLICEIYWIGTAVYQKTHLPNISLFRFTHSH